MREAGESGTKVVAAGASALGCEVSSGDERRRITQGEQGRVVWTSGITPLGATIEGAGGEVVQMGPLVADSGRLFLQLIADMRLDQRLDPVDVARGL
ncbi:hypothetical protein [Streptomyces cellulosae]|uniref:Uncharacterized protein n=1 Tax=Streptomyces cellulosae TaxID=1968 RepID=A0ABW7XU87_STRCE